MATPVTVTSAAEANIVGKAQIAKAREVDFVQQFTHNNLNKMLEVLSVTRKIAKKEGEELYVYTTTGTLQSGNVPEGEIIPLSQYETTKTPVGNITLGKWRKAVTAEAILKSGYTSACNDTDRAMMRDVQKGIRSNLFGFLNGSITGSVTATGAGLQKALANAWGKLQGIFEDDTVESVYFINPEDMADYLGEAKLGNTGNSTMFGMNYIESFLNLGTVIASSRITKGTFLATAKENLIMYYVDVNSGELAEAFDLTSDELGVVGIKNTIQNTERAQIESFVMSGIQFMVEYGAGVVKGTITATP